MAARSAGQDAGIPVVINARTDVYFGGARTDAEKFSEAVLRANAYLAAGADCAFVIAVSAPEVIEKLVREIHGPLNIIAGSAALDINVLAGLGVKRISLAGGMTRSVFGHFRNALAELRDARMDSFANLLEDYVNVHSGLQAARVEISALVENLYLRSNYP